MHRPLHSRVDIGCMYQEGERGFFSIEDCIHKRTRVLYKKSKERLIRMSIGNLKPDRKTTKQGNRNGKKNNNMDISSNKRNFTRENLDMATKGKSQERNILSSNSSTKQRHNE